VAHLYTLFQKSYTYFLPLHDSQKMLDWFAHNLMQANPDKFQALAIGKKTFKEQICFDLNGSILIF
jgi:hypothetical protein